MMYFVITNSDGDTHINRYSKQELEEALANEDWGSNVKFITAEELSRKNDPNYWTDDQILIIAGDIISPKPVEVVTKYEL